MRGVSVINLDQGRGDRGAGVRGPQLYAPHTESTSSMVETRQGPFHMLRGNARDLKGCMYYYNGPEDRV
jgi:hypothetical protein